MPSQTKLLIYAASALHRQAWRALLSAQPHIQVAGFIDYPQAPASAQAGTTILVDHPTPRPALVRQFRESNPQAGLLFLVSSCELGLILPLLQAGVTGCVSHDASVADLARAIIAVGRGEMFLPPDVAARALMALARGQEPESSLIEPLTGREQEVLTLLAQGHTNKDIAQTLFLSVRTVEAHLRNIYGKLGVHSRTEAALWALKHGHGAPNR
ncbi:MAG: response regulator transcription factor [Chloroflexi bacterium]|nr:response regulator transcription factor [Chloroflexota bacterium]